MELADRYGIDEFRLRSVLRLPIDVQAEMLHQIIKFNLNGRQVEEICEKGLLEHSTERDSVFSPQVRRFIKAMQKVNESDEEAFVSGVMKEKKNLSLARARIEATIDFLLRVKSKLPNE